MIAKMMFATARVKYGLVVAEGSYPISSRFQKVVKIKSFGKTSS